MATISRHLTNFVPAGQERAARRRGPAGRARMQRAQRSDIIIMRAQILNAVM